MMTGDELASPKVETSSDVHDSKIQDRDSRAKEKFFTLIETQKDPRPA
jgi:hypothetical protein